MTPLVKIALRYSLILAAIQLLVGLLVAFTVNYENPSPFLTVSIAVLGFIANIVIIVMAHARFEKETGSISFGQTIGIGYIIIGASMVASMVVTVLVSFISPPPANPFGITVSTADQIVASLLPQVLIGTVLLFLIILVESQWKIYTKAGKEGWAAVVPIYNVIVLLEIVKKPMVWFLLLLIPLVNIIFAIWVTNLVSKRFGKDEGFTVGMVLLPFVFYPILAFGNATYNGGDLEPQ